jgi:hypothetical protein
MSSVFVTVSHMEKLRAKLLSASEPMFMRMRTELACEAEICLKNPLYSVTFTKSRAVSQNPHDYYSEAPYWWPDPKNPGGKFIRRDGEYYPHRMISHPIDMDKMVHDVYILCAAGYLLDMPNYTRRAETLLRTWFLEPDTKMNPHLEYAQAIFGITNGRGIGIIDTVSLINVIAAMDYFTQDPQTARVTVNDIAQNKERVPGLQVDLLQNGPEPSLIAVDIREDIVHVLTPFRFPDYITKPYCCKERAALRPPSCLGINGISLRMRGTGR